MNGITYVVGQNIVELYAAIKDFLEMTESYAIHTSIIKFKTNMKEVYYACILIYRYVD